ncbi:MAG: hypothetical protein ACOYK8_05370 [Alphaproteobacteria bacterium]
MAQGSGEWPIIDVIVEQANIYALARGEKKPSTADVLRAMIDSPIGMYLDSFDLSMDELERDINYLQYFAGDDKPSKISAKKSYDRSQLTPWQLALGDVMRNFDEYLTNTIDLARFAEKYLPEKQSNTDVPVIEKLQMFP